jgi:hypothetical protein
MTSGNTKRRRTLLGDEHDWKNVCDKMTLPDGNK